MNMTPKRQKLDPDQYVMLTGKTEYEVELAPGVLDLWVEWYANETVTVSLLYASGLRLPYAKEVKGHFNVQTLNCLSVILGCSKSTTVCICVAYKELSKRERSEWTPVEIVPPRPAELQLSALVSEQVRRQLERMGVMEEKIEISEEDNLEEDIDDEGFGAGYMEEEEPAPPRKPKSAAEDKPAPAKEPGSRGDPANVSPGGEPAGDDSSEPVKA